MPRIKITSHITQPGCPVKVEVNGVCGPSCVDLTRPLETNLGMTDPAQTLSPEFSMSGHGEMERESN